MTDREREQHWQILQSEDPAFLRKTRGELEARLENHSRWAETMKNLVGNIPRERGEGRSEKFGQDALGKGLLAGIPTKEVDAALEDTRSQERLLVLLEEIDRRIIELTQGQSPSGESPAQQQKPAA